MTAEEAIEILKCDIHEVLPRACVNARLHNEAVNVAIEALEKQIEVDEMIDEIELTTWYHINTKGELVNGANPGENEPLYKAEDILKICARYRSEEE